jgi:Cu/Ag efflux pump CusA
LRNKCPIPQLKIVVNRDRALAYGVQPGAINEQLATLLGGKEVAELHDGERTLDLVMRLPAEWRDEPGKLAELPIESGLKSAEGAARRVPLRLVADVREATGPT